MYRCVPNLFVRFDSCTHHKLYFLFEKAFWLFRSQYKNILFNFNNVGHVNGCFFSTCGQQLQLWPTKFGI